MKAKTKARRKNIAKDIAINPLILDNPVVGDLIPGYPRRWNQ